MAESFLLLLPTGAEGPYSCAELQDLLRRGKARHDDRLRHASGPTHCLLNEIIPDALALEQQAPPVSTRMWRTASDRHRAAARARAEPPTTPVRAASAGATAPRPFPAASAALARSSNAGVGAQRRKQLVAVAVMLMCGCILWQELKAEGSSATSAHPFAGTTWSVTPRTKQADLRGVRLAFTTDTVVITSDGQTQSCAYRDETRADGEQHFTLAPAHPVLGASFSLFSDDTHLHLTAASGAEAELDPVLTAPVNRVSDAMKS